MDVKFARRLLGFIAMLFCKAAFARGGLPKVVSYSRLNVALYQGDSLQLDVEAEGEGLQYRWIRNHKTVCRQALCVLPTKDWSLGDQLLVVVVYNSRGSRSLRYRIKVLGAESGHESERVVPSIIDAPADAEEATDGFTVQALRGHGYSYSNVKVQVVGDETRALGWDESLRTAAGGVLALAVHGDGRPAEEHYLVDKTVVDLAAAESGRRSLKLITGTLRSRNLAPTAPGWSVLVDAKSSPWLQIDPSTDGDVVVSRVTDSDASVAVLRGYARVFVYAGNGPMPQGDGWVVPAGAILRFDKPGGSPALGVVTDDRLEKTLALTTPGYVDTTWTQGDGEKADADRQDSSVYGVSEVPCLEEAPKKLKAALSGVRKALARQDAMVAVEALAPFAGRAAAKPEIALRLGEAYVLLQAPEAAKAALSFVLNAKNAKAKIRSEAAETLGLVYLAAGENDKALAAFDADDSADLSAQAYYYRGVASYAGSKPLAARRYFTKALWQRGDAAIQDSARAYLRKLVIRKHLAANVAVAGLYDSNFLRAAAGSALPDGVTKRSGGAYSVTGAASGKLWTDEAGELGLSVAADKTAHASGAKALDLMGERLALNLEGYFGGERENASLDMRLEPYARMLFIGSERAQDALGFEASVRLLNLRWKPGLLYTFERALDPFPDRDSILDPVTFEETTSTDRSHGERNLGLELNPVASEVWAWRVVLGNQTVDYSDSASHVDSFRAMALSSDFSFWPQSRSSALLDLAYRNRRFAAASDKRIDQMTTVTAGWRWLFTPELSEVITASYEAQHSTRALNTYKRLLFSFATGFGL